LLFTEIKKAGIVPAFFVLYPFIINNIIKSMLWAGKLMLWCGKLMLWCGKLMLWCGSFSS